MKRFVHIIFIAATLLPKLLLGSESGPSKVFHFADISAALSNSRAEDLQTLGIDNIGDVTQKQIADFTVLRQIIKKGDDVDKFKVEVETGGRSLFFSQNFKSHHLSYAAHKGRLKIVEYILGKGFTVDRPCCLNKTALALAVLASDKTNQEEHVENIEKHLENINEIIKLLLTRGADPKFKVKFNNSALEIAQKQKNPLLIKLLSEPLESDKGKQEITLKKVKTKTIVSKNNSNKRPLEVPNQLPDELSRIEKEVYTLINELKTDERDMKILVRMDKLWNRMNDDQFIRFVVKFFKKLELIPLTAHNYVSPTLIWGIIPGPKFKVENNGRLLAIFENNDYTLTFPIKNARLFPHVDSKTETFPVVEAIAQKNDYITEYLIIERGVPLDLKMHVNKFYKAKPKHLKTITRNNYIERNMFVDAINGLIKNDQNCQHQGASKDRNSSLYRLDVLCASMFVSMEIDLGQKEEAQFLDAMDGITWSLSDEVFARILELSHWPLQLSPKLIFGTNKKSDHYMNTKKMKMVLDALGDKIITDEKLTKEILTHNKELAPIIDSIRCNTNNGQETNGSYLL